MSENSRIWLVVLLLAVPLAWWSIEITADDTKSPAREGGGPKDSAAADKEDLSHFMRLKLGASGKVLEGLATEDFGLVKEGAEELHKMSTAEKWRVSNDALYRNFSGDFQRVTKDLVEAAKEENLDRAALKWMDATMNCIECHRYARGVMIAAHVGEQRGQP